MPSPPSIASTRRACRPTSWAACDLLRLIPKDFDVLPRRGRQIRLFRSRIIGRRAARALAGARSSRWPRSAPCPRAAASRDVPTGGLIHIDAGTALQAANHGDDDLLVYAYGYPPENEHAEILDPATRFAEDPVRMLRAMKFLARLQLQPTPEVAAAMSASAELIGRSSPARVLEEIYKLMACGRAQRALPLLVEHGLLQRLLPEVAPY